MIVLEKYANVWNGIKSKIKAINGDECDYGKDYMKIKFKSDNNLPLKKLLKFHLMTIIVMCVFSEDGKLYPQLFLDDICMSWYKNVAVSKNRCFTRNWCK